MRGQKGRAMYYEIVRYRVPAMFDAPYILTMGKDEVGTPFVRYQLLPAHIAGHRCNVVYAEVYVQPTLTIKIPSAHFHCINCKLMGTINTLREYRCNHA